MKAGVHYSWKIFCPRACRVGCVWGGECNTHTHTHTHTFLKFGGILTKYVGKISSPNVVGKFGVLAAMQNSINIQSHKNQIFTGDDGFYRSYFYQRL